MKILINTISREDIINKTELAAKGSVVEIAFADTLSAPKIAGHNFIVGEWIHIDEKDVEANAELLAKYPDIKEAHIVLADQMKIAIEERNLHHFAQGIQDAADLYKQALPEIADTVLKIVPIKVEKAE
jgi:hypothetical protein